jgi:hypothetical protein
MSIIKVSSHWELKMTFDELCNSALFGFRDTNKIARKDDKRPHIAIKREGESIRYIMLDQHCDGIYDNAEGVVGKDYISQGNFTFYNDCREMTAEYLIACGCPEFVT